MKHKGPHLYQIVKIKGLTRTGNSKFSTFAVKRIIYKCMLPDCSHYLNEPEFGINRLSLCNGKCGESVSIDRSMPQKPMCNNCKEKRKLARQIA